MTAPYFFWFAASKKLRNWPLKAFIFFIWSFLASHLRNRLWKIAIICRRKWAGDLFWHWQAAIRCWSSAKGKKIAKKSQKVHKTMANLALQKVRPGSSILPQFLLPTRVWKAGCWAAKGHPKRLHIALFPNGSPSGYMGPTGDLFSCPSLDLGTLFCPRSPF